MLSPPGNMSPSHWDSSWVVRTSMNRHWRSEVGLFAEAARRSWMCSLNAPWRARTPTVIVRGGIVTVIVPISVFLIDKVIYGRKHKSVSLESATTSERAAKSYGVAYR